METLQERLNNLMMFLGELAGGKLTEKEIGGQADYHIATLDLLRVS